MAVYIHGDTRFADCIEDALEQVYALSVDEACTRSYWKETERQANYLFNEEGMRKHYERKRVPDDDNGGLF